MIPDLPNLSSPTMAADFRQPYNREKQPLSDHARGGAALLDASSGLNVKNWFAEVNGGVCFLSTEGVAPFAIESFPSEISWISLAFDQNMHYSLAYTIGSQSYLYWYDAEAQKYVTDTLGAVASPFVRMDDVRDYVEGMNDIILSYIRGGALCVRMQRDRYKREYVLATRAGNRILQCGMNVKLRFQWNCA